MKKVSQKSKDKACMLLQQGRTVKEVEEETGLSNGTVKAIKKELKATNSNSSDIAIAGEELTSSKEDYITNLEAKYIAKLGKELELFTDEDEGWVYHLTAEELRKKTSGIWFSGIMYPTPEDPNGNIRIDKLRLLGMEIAISPLHDKDTRLDKETGKFIQKKAHWHFIIKSPVKIGYREMNNTIREITEGPYIQKCMSLKGAYEYFIHLNHPEKYQYEASEIQTYNGWTIDLNKHERMELLASVVTEIHDNQNVDTMSQLVSIHLHEEEYINVVSTHSHMIKSLLTENWRLNHPDYVREVRIRKD